MKKIPVYQPSLHGNEKTYVNECLDTGWISSKGEFVHQFETQFANYIQAPYATTVSNGTVALHLALLALDIKPGDEIIVPTLTYIASVNAIKYMGATPVFVDSLRDTWQMDMQEVKEKITDKTRAIMAVHLYGHPCDMHTLMTLAENNQLRVIEDCAESFGAYYANQHTGTWGDIATFSFYGNKTITTGEGGMVVCHDEQLYKKLCHLKNQGIDESRQYWHDIIGYNYRMTNISAAIGLAQLEQADRFIARKREIADYYTHQLKTLPLTLHTETGDVKHAYWMYSIHINETNKRDALRKYLETKGIETRPVFYPVHTMPMYETSGAFPEADYVAAGGINLPSWPGLSNEDLEYICDAISSFFAI